MRSGPRPAPRVNSPSPTFLGSSSRFPSDRYVARSLRSCARRIPPDPTQTPLRASANDDVDVRGKFWWQKNPPVGSEDALDPALKPNNGDGPQSILKSPGKPKSPGRMTRAERHAAGMERAMKELERVAAHNPELRDALALIRRGPDGAITVGSLRRAEAALRERYAAAAERKKAEAEAERRAKEDEAEIERLKAELASGSPGSAASTPRRINPPEPSKRTAWSSPANPFPADATISPAPTTPGDAPSPSPVKKPSPSPAKPPWNPTIRVDAPGSPAGAKSPKSPSGGGGGRGAKSPGGAAAPVASSPRTIASYVERHALHARRAFELLAGARGGTDADTVASFLRRFCGERDAPAAELAAVHANLRTRPSADNVTFSDLTDVLGFQTDASSPAPRAKTSIAKAAADHYPYEIDPPPPPPFSPARSDASSAAAAVRRSADLGHRVTFADPPDSPGVVYPPPPEDPAKPSAPPSPLNQPKSDQPPEPADPAAPSAPPAPADAVAHTSYDAYDAEVAAAAMSAAREALDAAALAAAALPPAVGPPPPVPVPPRPDVTAAAERAILERAAAYQRAMSEEASSPLAPGSAGSISSTAAARRNPRLDEWTAEVARERREVERKMLLRESERAARAALEDQWSAFLERDVEPSDEFLAKLARQHRERANEVERLKSDAAVTAERLRKELDEAKARDEVKRELLGRLHDKASEMAKADADARETEAEARRVKESLPPVAKVVSTRFEDWRSPGDSVAAPALGELSAAITRDLDGAVARVVRAVSGGDASSSARVGESFYVAPPPFKSGPYTLVAPPVAPVHVPPTPKEPEMTQQQRAMFEQQLQLNAMLRRQHAHLTQQLKMREAEEATSHGWPSTREEPPSTREPPSTPPPPAEKMRTVPPQWQSPSGEPAPPGVSPPPPPAAPSVPAKTSPLPAPPPASEPSVPPPRWDSTAVPLPAFPAPAVPDLSQPRWTGPAPPLWRPEERAPGFGEPRGQMLTGNTPRDYVSDVVENAYRSTLEQQRVVFGKR